jgi:tRNA-uridine 2-sulfurtransferase
MSNKEKTCIALFSGGLDSLLAITLMKKLGYNVIMLNFNSGFFFKAYNNEGDRQTWKAPTPKGFEIRVVDISADFFEMMKNPKHGFGSALNPCIDCKILMLQKAKSMMEELGAGFVITGEVLGQRPMSQNAQAIRQIEKESGLEGWLVRPLCAKNLPPTEPEKLGWIKREEMLDISGRSRKRQFALAKEWGLDEFVKTPAGGCILTDEVYAGRLKRYLMQNAKCKMQNEIPNKNFEPLTQNNELYLLSVGRHFVKDDVEFILGRNKAENDILEKFSAKGTLFHPPEIPGPTAFTAGSVRGEMELLIASAVAVYSDAKNEQNVNIEISAVGEKKIVSVAPADKKDLSKFVF